MTTNELEHINTLLLQTLTGEAGRYRRAGLTWRRTGPETWDIYKPGQCPCGAPKWTGLSLEAAAAVLIARLKALDAINRGGLCLN